MVCSGEDFDLSMVVQVEPEVVLQCHHLGTHKTRGTYTIYTHTYTHTSRHAHIHMHIAPTDERVFDMHDNFNARAMCSLN